MNAIFVRYNYAILNELRLHLSECESDRINFKESNIHEITLFTQTEFKKLG